MATLFPDNSVIVYEGSRWVVFTTDDEQLQVAVQDDPERRRLRVLPVSAMDGAVLVDVLEGES